MAQKNRIAARAEATLVIATVAASASLLFLILAIQFSNRSPIWNWIGFMFSLLGPTYREVTIFTIDYFDYKKTEEQQEYPLWTTLPRMLIIRFMLYLPIAAWIILFRGPRCFLLMMILTATSALALSALELLQRERLHQEKSPIGREMEETPPSRRQEIEDPCGRVDRLFDIALLLVTAFSATVLSYVAFADLSMTEVGFSFKALTLPWVVLILLWLIRGLVPSRGRILFCFKMLLRQFCWAFFCLIFNLLVLSFVFLLYTKDPLALLLLQNQLGFLLIPINVLAMWNYAECCPGVVSFRHRRLAVFAWVIGGPFLFEILSWVLIRSIM